jgi:hypothetical protein
MEKMEMSATFFRSKEQAGAVIDRAEAEAKVIGADIQTVIDDLERGSLGPDALGCNRAAPG